jgi:isopentenyl diphosphate isomerase/L-lactate dehydrogenase-like FMN-dependent dehydrogenase
MHTGSRAPFDRLAEIERAMKLMGRASISQLSRENLRFR